MQKANRIKIFRIHTLEGDKQQREEKKVGRSSYNFLATCKTIQPIANLHKKKFGNFSDIKSKVNKH